MTKIRNIALGLLAVGLFARPTSASLSEIASVQLGAGDGGYSASALDTTDNIGIFGSSTSVFVPLFTSSVSLVAQYTLANPNTSTPLSAAGAQAVFSSFTYISAAAF